MDKNLFDSRLRLSLAVGLGPVLTRRLIDAFGSPGAVCDATHAQLCEIDGIGLIKADKIYRAINEADVDAERQLIQEFGAHVLTIQDDGYPPLLRHIIDPPQLLYVRGALCREDSLSLGIVGSRRCTQYGREQADRLSAL
ncbi:MAG: DNA-processing protein DprA, partial [Planctomycetota bacterium]